MVFLYKILTNILYPFLLFIFISENLLKKNILKDLKKNFFFNFNCIRKENFRLLWFHAASIGELNSIIPIIHNLNSNNNFQFLVTTSTLSSSELAIKEFSNFQNIYHRFFPLDVDFLMSKFVQIWKLIQYFWLTQKFGQI